MKMNNKGNGAYVALWIVLGIALIIGLGFGGLWYKGYFGPKYQEIDREIWEQTTSRIHGSTQEIGKRYLEYQKADEDEKVAICSYLRTSYPNLDSDNIDDYKLRQFFNNCRYGEN